MIFCGFFCLLFTGKISEAAMLGAGVGGNYVYFTAPVVNGLELYCSTCTVYIEVPKCMPHRRNLFPPPPPKVSVSSDDWIEGLALCILSGLGGRVERKKPFTRATRVR